MDTHPQQKLEELIHKELSQLQERQAPKTLIPRVLAKIRAQEHKPWWRCPWTQWPFKIQMAAFPLMLSSVVAAVYAMSLLLGQASFGPVSDQLDSLSMIWEVLGTLGNAVMVLGRATGPGWLLLVMGIPLAMYLACVGLGTLCFQMGFHHRNRMAFNLR